MKSGILFTIIALTAIISFSSTHDIFANHQDDYVTINLKSKIQNASPILDTGFISTASGDYQISNQFEIRHIWPGELMRLSGITVDGYPYYAVHKMNLNDIEIYGTIFVNGKPVPIIKNTIAKEPSVTVPETKEPAKLVQKIPVPIKAVILQPHMVYWRDTYSINIKVFEADKNPLNDYWYREYLVPDVPVSVQLTHENGKHLATIQGKTDQDGHWEGQQYITENIVQGGKYLVEVIIGDKSAGQKQNLVTFVSPQLSSNLISNNKAPVAVAGPDQNIGVGTPNVILDGTGSYDPESDPITYLWTQVSGPGVVINNAMTDTANFNHVGAGTYVFQLAVTAGGKTGTDQITINVT